MAVATSIPVLNLNKISTSVYNTKKKISLTNQSILSRNNSIQENITAQKKLINENSTYYRRREELDEKNKQEAALEAPDTVKKINYINHSSLSSVSDKGFIGRLLSFAGYLAAGWILTRLPTLINFGEGFLVRLQTAKDIIGTFFSSTLEVLQSFGKLLGNVTTSILRIGITDDRLSPGQYSWESANSINRNFDQLLNGLSKLYGSLTTAFSFIIDPLGFKIAEREEEESRQQQGQSQDAYADDGSSGAMPTESTGPIDSGPVPKNDSEAFEKVRAAAQKAGSPAPDITAAIAMNETGYLRNPNSVYFASNKTNPFGQTGVGSAGYVIGADKQKHAVYKTFDEGVAVHVRLWKKYYAGTTADEILRSLVAAGYNTATASWRPTTATIYERFTKKSRNVPVSSQGTVGPSPSGMVDRSQPNIQPSKPTGKLKSIGGGHSLDSGGAADAYIKMRDEAKKQGVNLTLSSSFRSYEQQNYLYQLYLKGQGNLAAPPGRSNHEKGLAIDVANGIPWVQKYGSKFGWINTGMGFSQKEPWHFDFKGSVSPSATQEQTTPTPAAIQRPSTSTVNVATERRGENYVVVDQRSPRVNTSRQNNYGSSGSSGGNIREEDLAVAFMNNMKKRLMNDLAYV